MSRERLAVFLPDLGGGGAERAMVDLASSFSERCDVDLVLAKHGGALRERVAPSVRLVELNARRVSTSLPRLARYLRVTRPDAVLSGLTHANIVAILAREVSRTRPALVVVEHSNLTTSTAQSPRRRDRAFPIALRVVYPRADAVVAVSNDAADDLADQIGFDRHRISVLPNPIDVDAIRRRATEPTTHPWLDEPDGGPVAIAVGRLTPAKDFPTLIRALAVCRKTVPLRLVILGEGEERGTLTADIDSLGLSDAVALPGFVSNPYSYLRAADVFVLSSRWEGLPTVLLEALAVGTPVVSTDCRSGPSEILRQGELGRLVPVGDVGALADAMLAALEGPSPKVGSVLDDYAPAAVRSAYARTLGLSIEP